MKTKKLCFFISFLFVLQGQHLQAFPGSYPIQNFTPEDYKAGIQNIDFAQNRDMTLFVANNLGLLAFDGNTWTRHDFRTGKKKRSLAFDETTNRLYVGSQGEFGYFQEDWQYISLTDRIPGNFDAFDEVWDVFINNSRVYFCTFQAIFIYDGQSIEVLEHGDGFERSFLVNEKIFTQDQQGRLFEIDGPDLLKTYPQEIQGQIIAGMIPHDEGLLLIYHSGDIELTTSLGAQRRYRTLTRALRGTYVNHVLQLSDTRLAVSTQTSGLFLYDLDEGVIENLSTEDGLESNACLRAFQDYFGNLWVGMQNGIALIQIHSPMRLIGSKIQLQGSGYAAYQTETGTYFTTSNGIYFLGRSADQCIFMQGTEGPAYSIQEIAGRYYAGHHTGLFILERGRARRIATTDGLWQVTQLQSRPEYAIGGTYSGLYLFRLDAFQGLQPVRQISGFNASSRFLEEDRAGRIWVGQYYQGLYQLTLSDDLTEVAVKNVTEGSDLPILEQIILSRVDEDFFLATNSGLYQLDPASLTIDSTNIFSSQIGNQPVYLIAQDRANNVHIAADENVGFFRQISASNYLYVPSSLYQLRYHLNNDLLHISVNADDGILFSANEGFIQYDPEQEIPFKADKPIVIKRVYSVTEDKALYFKKPFDAKPDSIFPLEIDAKARVLTIEVESFQFNDMGNQQFRYLLQGFDEEFGDWTTASTKEYTNLTEGKYAFVAQTRNYLGEISTSQVVQLTVNPPFHRSNLAKLLYVLIGSILLFLVLRLQQGRYKRKAMQIEEARQRELARKQQKLAEIERQKEQELVRLNKEKMQNELQHVNAMLTASTMNLVVKNEFIESIREELNAVKRTEKDAEIKKALEKIVNEINITLKLQEDWEQFEYHFDAVHGEFLTRLRNHFPDLSPNEQKLCTFLRLNLNTKEISNLLGISVRGVEVARYRLRKKLGLKKGQNLSKFILEY